MKSPKAYFKRRYKETSKRMTKGKVLRKSRAKRKIPDASVTFEVDAGVRHVRRTSGFFFTFS